MKLQKILLILVALVASFFPIKWGEISLVKAGSFTIIKTATQPDMYLRLSIGRYKIRDMEAFNRWGFNWGMVSVISAGEMASIPQGPDVTRAMRPFGNPTVYVVENAQMRAVTSAEAFILSGYKWSDVSDVESILINQLPRTVNLTPPPVVRSPSDGKIYYLWGGQKHHITSPDVWNNWGFQGYTETEAVNTIPTGSPLTKLVRPYGDPTVWVIDHAKRRALPSIDALILNNLNWSDVVDADAGLIASLPVGDLFYAPTTVKVPGSDTLYFVHNSKRYPVKDTDTYDNWGFNRFGSTVSAAAATLPIGSTLTRLVRTEDGTVWRVKDNAKKTVPTAGVFAGYGFQWSDVADVPLRALDILANAGSLPYTTDVFQGMTIPFTSGKTGLEQHLLTTSGDNTEAEHYALTNVPQTGSFLNCTTRGCIRNGVAGIGAFGRLDPLVEQYYITMRWNYCTWGESATLDSYGKPTTTCTGDVSGASSKANHKYKKIIVSNLRTGKKIVAAVGEAGPAIWVTRERGVVAGLSPEGIDYLQATYNASGDTLEYGWSVDQSLPLGPLNY